MPGFATVSGNWRNLAFTEPQLFAAHAPAQRWGHAVLELMKVAGFLAGLFGFFLLATKGGAVTKVFMALAVIGGIFYLAVWIWLAATARFTIVYVLGGMWYQMVAPVALGVAALSARRAPWWYGGWAIAVGVINSQIFPLLGPGRALVVQGIIWLVFGYMVHRLVSRSAIA